MFSIEDEPIPWNFPEHTRSVPWLVESQVVRSLQTYSAQLGIDAVHTPTSDTSAWDCILSYEGEIFFVDIKTFASGSEREAGDLISIERWNRFRTSTGAEQWEGANGAETTLNFVYFEVSFNANEIRIGYEKVIPIEFISWDNNSASYGRHEFRIKFTATGRGNDARKVGVAGDFVEVHRSTAQFDDVLRFMQSSRYLRAGANITGTGSKARKRAAKLRAWRAHRRASPLWE